jgi:hypothetical protein
MDIKFFRLVHRINIGEVFIGETKGIGSFYLLFLNAVWNRPGGL